MRNSKEIKTLQDELINAGLYEINTYETAAQTESFFLTPLNQEETGLPMCVHLRCVDNRGEPPFLRFQNDRNTRYSSNWVKMYLEGVLDNYENKNIIFSENEMQLLQNWIALNKQTIINHYYQEYDSYEVCMRLKKLK